MSAEPTLQELAGAATAPELLAVPWFADIRSANRARDLMDRQYSADAAGRQPRCDGEAAVRDAGYSIASDNGAQL